MSSRVLADICERRYGLDPRRASAERTETAGTSLPRWVDRVAGSLCHTMSDPAVAEPPRAHARIVYLGPVSPHWEVYGDWGDRTVLDEFRARVLARLVLLPRDDPQFRRNRERVVRDAERELISHRVGSRPSRRRTDRAPPARGPVARAACQVCDHELRTMDDRFINRELSWLAFDDRVLAARQRAGIPLLERAKFCAITTTNLDEFFQVRVAALKDQVAAGDRGADAGRAHGDPAAGRRSPCGPASWSPARRPCSSTSSCRRWPRRASRSSRWSELEAERPQGDDRGLRAAGVPRADAARRRPEPPVPVHLRPRPVGATAFVRDPETMRAPVRPRQGARPVPPARARSTSERFLPAEELVIAHLDTLFVGHGHRGGGDVPRHPQRRPHGGGRGGGRPARGGGDGAAPPPVQPRRAPRGRRRR